MATFLEYFAAAMRHAEYERRNEEWFASIPGFDGLWATGETVEDARKDLSNALDGWITVHLIIGKNRAPDVGEFSLYSATDPVKD